MSTEKKLGIVTYCCHPSRKLRRISPRLVWAKKQTPISKIIRVKKD
jgi:hypothetical protein